MKGDGCCAQVMRSLQYNAQSMYSRNEGAPGTWMVIKCFPKLSTSQTLSPGVHRIQLGV